MSKKLAVKEIRINKQHGGIEVVPTSEYSKELHSFLKKQGFKWHRVGKYYYRGLDEKIYDKVMEKISPVEKAPTKSAVSAGIKSREKIVAELESKKAEKKPSKKADSDNDLIKRLQSLSKEERAALIALLE